MDHSPDSDAGRRHRGRSVHHHRIHLSRTMTGYEIATFSIRGFIAWSAHPPRETGAASIVPPRRALSAAEATQPYHLPSWGQERPENGQAGCTSTQRSAPANSARQRIPTRQRVRTDAKPATAATRCLPGAALPWLSHRRLRPGARNGLRSPVKGRTGPGARPSGTDRRAKGICPSAMDGVPTRAVSWCRDTPRSSNRAAARHCREGASE